MQRAVTVIGKYRVYRGHSAVWWVMSRTTGMLISKHAARDLAEAAAKRYDEGDKRRATARRLLEEKRNARVSDQEA